MKSIKLVAKDSKLMNVTQLCLEAQKNVEVSDVVQYIQKEFGFSPILSNENSNSQDFNLNQTIYVSAPMTVTIRVGDQIKVELCCDGDLQIIQILKYYQDHIESRQFSSFLLNSKQVDQNQSLNDVRMKGEFKFEIELFYLLNITLKYRSFECSLQVPWGIGIREVLFYFEKEIKNNNLKYTYTLKDQYGIYSYGLEQLTDYTLEVLDEDIIELDSESEDDDDDYEILVPEVKKETITVLSTIEVKLAFDHVSGRMVMIWPNGSQLPLQ